MSWMGRYASYGGRPQHVPCPVCGRETAGSEEWVDIGVGLQQVTPHTCQCGAWEMGGYELPVTLTSFEDYYGWYLPGRLHPGYRGGDVQQEPAARREPSEASQPGEEHGEVDEDREGGVGGPGRS